MSRIIKKWSDFGISTRYENSSFSDIEKVISESKIEAVKEWTSGKATENGLYIFYETPGTGKTILGVLAFKDLVKNDANISRAFFISMRNLIYKIKYQYEETADLMEKMLGSSLLMIDDIDDVLADSDKVIEKVNIVIDEFYNYPEKKLILTGNSTLPRLKEVFGARSYSRLFEMCLQLELGGSDFRFGNN